jgi:hypothetical protein
MLVVAGEKFNPVHYWSMEPEFLWPAAATRKIFSLANSSTLWDYY